MSFISQSEFYNLLHIAPGSPAGWAWQWWGTPPRWRGTCCTGRPCPGSSPRACPAQPSAGTRPCPDNTSTLTSLSAVKKIFYFTCCCSNFRPLVYLQIFNLTFFPVSFNISTASCTDNKSLKFVIFCFQGNGGKSMKTLIQLISSWISIFF